MTRRDVPTTDPLLIRVEEAARLLGVSRTTAYELVRAGEISSIRIGRARRIPRAAVEAFIAQRIGASDER